MTDAEQNAVWLDQLREENKRLKDMLVASVDFICIEMDWVNFRLEMRMESPSATEKNAAKLAAFLRQEGFAELVKEAEQREREGRQ